MKKVMIVFLAVTFSLAGFAQDTKSKEANATEKKIPANSKVFLAPMGGFEDDLKAAIQSKKVPVVLVTDKDQADYEIAGTAESQKAGAVKKAVMWNWHSNEQASITVTEHKSGEVVFAYSVNKKSSAHGKRSTAEACAKHLKEQIEGK
ncbi:MAG TPA: hypothetical protein VHW72_17555 [Candidatus Angelobacter sp.]|jgi:hypothetical protein|nr:hypothetical protein [Candidatus Angelobacter sp.]